jgi:anti-sigma-K factor RskA
VTCGEFQDLAAAYVLGALDPEERTACEAHLRRAEPHEGCEEALHRARATAAALASALPPAAPGPEVWQAIEARAGLAPRRASRLAWPAALSAAAAALLIVLWQGARRDAERARGEAATALRLVAGEAEGRAALARELGALRAALRDQRELAALLDSPGARVVALGAVPGRSGSAAAVVDLATRRALIVSASLPAEPGRTWQLWVLRGAGPPRAAGFLRPVEGGLHVGAVDPALLAAAPDALAVSLEPEGGSPAPTDVRLVGKLGS